MLKTISLLDVSNIAIEAGKIILDIYHTDFSVDQKEDNSPLTQADQKSHEIITSGLKEITPDIPILSEEGNHASYEERKNWDWLWIIDPLDGTKEFVKKNGEFTVNIALVYQGKPVLGVIYAPDLKTLYVGRQDQGAYKLHNVRDLVHTNDTALLEQSESLPFEKKTDVIQVVASRSHLTPETEAFVEDVKKNHKDVQLTSAGSSLKICLIAEGTADYYPRYAPTMEWDTAAGQAILEASGGKMLIKETEDPLLYNKEDLLNPWFLAKR